ncbi:hypothetical protein UFOVP939_40 [uncultured Caudovirales phage]|uniref:Uncharacterized protein n=1 Tax=uncultured Caudovirales phage TaxID=2100421 RepID=A0A6J5PLI2_9CAUD|nr:hypothetical protein UFOVP939_40 [uncultured Caudovirales phage]
MTTKYKRKIVSRDEGIVFLCILPVILVLVVIGYFIGLIL